MDAIEQQDSENVAKRCLAALRRCSKVRPFKWARWHREENHVILDEIDVSGIGDLGNIEFILEFDLYGDEPYRVTPQMRYHIWDEMGESRTVGNVVTNDSLAGVVTACVAHFVEWADKVR